MSKKMIYKRQIVKGTSPNEDKLIAIFDKRSDGKTRVYYQDKKKRYRVNDEKIQKMRKLPRSSKYILIEFDPREYKSPKQQCKAVVKEAKFLKQLTNGQINLFRTGSVAKTSLQLFYDLCHAHEDPEQISERESQILQKATNGPMIWSKPYDGYAYKYDVVSEYPSIMMSKFLKIPFGGVEYSIITNKDLETMTFFKYGIYHCIVHNADSRLFRNNSQNWYTHTDLNYAMITLKCRIEMIEDGEENAMIYSKFRLIRPIFQPFVDYLFGFKKKW